MRQMSGFHPILAASQLNRTGFTVIYHRNLFDYYEQQKKNIGGCQDEPSSSAKTDSIFPGTSCNSLAS